MRCLVIIAVLVAVCSAQFGSFGQNRLKPFAARPAAAAPRPVAPARAVSGSDQAANILRFDNDVNPDGSYNYAYETDNGIAAQAQGTLRAFGGNPPAAADVAQGSFAWTSPEGIPVSISYTADENGYQPQGDVLPVGPPIPPQIARALEYIARNPQKQ